MLYRHLLETKEGSLMSDALKQAERCSILQMCRSTTHQTLWRTRITLSQKENDNPLDTKFNVTEYRDWTDREFKQLPWRNSTSYEKIQKGSLMSSEIKLMNKRNTSNNTELLKKNQTEILELRNSVNKVKYALDSTGNWARW